MFEDYINAIDDIAFPDLIRKTSLDKMPRFSKVINNNVLLKREDAQAIFSFKIRGAFHKITQLSDEEKQRGIITASAGNHAQGVAISAKKMGINATIVMPLTTPKIKIDSVSRLGGKILLWGDNYQQAWCHVQKIADERNLVYIPPFDDRYTICGQGTIGKEILEQFKGCINAIFIPVGGGGLCAGVSMYLKHYCPSIKIIAVESKHSACLKAAMAAGRPVMLDEVGRFDDGTAVSQIGDETFAILQHTVDDIILVDDDEVCAAIKDIYEDTRSIAEPSGALALAGLKAYVAEHQLSGMNLVAINSGANMNFERLRYIADRVNIGESKEIILATTIPEKIGSFRKFCNDLGGVDITEFNYRYSDGAEAAIFISIRIQNKNEREKVFDNLHDAGYKTFDLTDDETVKLHLRHFIGGNRHVDNEQIFRFELPERPGTLIRFLTHLGSRWNISLFHYRHQGAAEGSVLIGLQIPDFEMLEAEQLFKEIGMRFQCETHNKVVEMFLLK